MYFIHFILCPFQHKKKHNQFDSFGIAQNVLCGYMHTCDTYMQVTLPVNRFKGKVAALVLYLYLITLAIFIASIALAQNPNVVCMCGGVCSIIKLVSDCIHVLPNTKYKLGFSWISSWLFHLEGSFCLSQLLQDTLVFTKRPTMLVTTTSR